MMRNPDACTVMFGISTRGKENPRSSRWVDLRPKILTPGNSIENRGLYSYPLPQGSILFTPRLPGSLSEQLAAAIQIPRGYREFVLAHRTEDVGDFSVWEQIPSLVRLMDPEGFVHSLHRVNADGSESLLGVGFQPRLDQKYGAYLNDEIVIAENENRQLVMTLSI